MASLTSSVVNSSCILLRLYVGVMITPCQIWKINPLVQAFVTNSAGNTASAPYSDYLLWGINNRYCFVFGPGIYHHLVTDYITVMEENYILWFYLCNFVVPRDLIVIVDKRFRSIISCKFSFFISLLATVTVLTGFPLRPSVINRDLSHLCMWIIYFTMHLKVLYYLWIRCHMVSFCHILVEF